MDQDGIENKIYSKCDLPEGWKKLEVLRKYGASKGKRDIYYISPKNVKFRSKVGLVKYFGSSLDLSTFDYKTGKMRSRLLSNGSCSKSHTAKYVLAHYKEAKARQTFANTSIFSRPFSNISTTKIENFQTDKSIKNTKVEINLGKKQEIKDNSTENMFIDILSHFKINENSTNSESPMKIITPSDIANAIISTLKLENGISASSELSVSDIIVKLADRIDDESETKEDSEINTPIFLLNVTKEDIEDQQNVVDVYRQQLKSLLDSD